LDVLKKSDEKQVFFLERPKSKNLLFDVFITYNMCGICVAALEKKVDVAK